MSILKEVENFIQYDNNNIKSIIILLPNNDTAPTPEVSLILQWLENNLYYHNQYYQHHINNLKLLIHGEESSIKLDNSKNTINIVLSRPGASANYQKNTILINNDKYYDLSLTEAYDKSYKDATIINSCLPEKLQAGMLMRLKHSHYLHPKTYNNIIVKKLTPLKYQVKKPVHGSREDKKTICFDILPLANKLSTVNHISSNNYYSIINLIAEAARYINENTLFNKTDLLHNISRMDAYHEAVTIFSDLDTLVEANTVIHHIADRNKNDTKTQEEITTRISIIDKAFHNIMLRGMSIINYKNALAKVQESYDKQQEFLTKLEMSRQNHTELQNWDNTYLPFLETEHHIKQAEINNQAAIEMENLSIAVLTSVEYLKELANNNLLPVKQLT